MLIVAIMGSHAGSQALGKVCHRLVDVGFVAAVSIWSAERLSTRQSSSALAGVYGTFPACHHRRDSPVGSNLESLGPLILFYQSHPHITRENNVRNIKNYNLHFSKVVQQHYVGEVDKSVTFVLYIIPIYTVSNNVEMVNFCRHYS